MNKYTRLINEVYNDVRRMINETEREEYNDWSVYNEEPDYHFTNLEFYYNITQDLLHFDDDFSSAEAGDRVVFVNAYAIPEYYRGEFETFTIGLDVDDHAYIIPEGDDWDEPIEEPDRFEGLTKQQENSIISQLDPDDFWDVY
jgi:hypothetical protein